MGFHQHSPPSTAHLDASTPESEILKTVERRNEREGMEKVGKCVCVCVEVRNDNSIQSSNNQQTKKKTVLNLKDHINVMLLA